MLFNSIEFFVFLPIVLLLYRVLTLRGQNRILLLASYIFYGWWDVRFLFLILVSTIVDYCCGLIIGAGRISNQRLLGTIALVIPGAIAFLGLPWKRFSTIESRPLLGQTDPLVYRWWIDLSNRLEVYSRVSTESNSWGLVVAAIIGACLFGGWLYWIQQLEESKRRQLALISSICSNLGILGVFKYCNFFVENLEAGLEGLGLPGGGLRLDIVLPVGISFYTFQTMSYTIDVYRRRMKPVYDLGDFALFVSYFPQLVAGPIERAEQLIPRLQASRRVGVTEVAEGSFLILFGLFKKIAIADGVALSVNKVFGISADPSALDIVGGTLLFAIQIYCDFSGYSSIARGTSKLLGIDLMLNFNLPYFSRGPSEFWRRWHISLSSWLRDYLYIPLGGNRGSHLGTIRNLMLTMILGGLWHGAAWNFLLWGFYHGIILAVARAIPPILLNQHMLVNRLLAGFQILGFSVITLYGWLLFRAESLSQVVTFTRKIFRLEGIEVSVLGRPTFSAMVGLLILIPYELLEYSTGKTFQHQPLPNSVRGFFIAILLVTILMGLSNEPTQFIYFQF